MDETKERNLKLVNEYFDKLRADLLELLEKHDDVNLDMEPLNADETCITEKYTPSGTKITIKQGDVVKFGIRTA
ncbi:hypothetical protein [Sphingobacterium sp. SGR-19]|uniref:hypothetical protein n=1 Tax=Sphingobacterium sp. SGR-19 TaxID=2710886 RepID=UPI0013EAD0C5|nr:hypothetical protein [Sphingobacterium sp. SGR-19]NGM66857.1 hypothetical protein [Sphingobacterium sp. SGR-19]